ncbi:MAG: cupin domain-containing protein [Nitrososphaerota archaeon]|nr:cupin domain-containing protein [Candidatus Bathyarchaeota archaeon]MDW8062264.1 cupin domain-containing protein [Nitrososphaerota archaeon]
MRVFKYQDVPIESVEGGAFCYRAEVQRFITPDVSKDFRVFIVHFPAGHKTRWHTHSSDQVLYILDGAGIVANEHASYEVTPGMLILIPAGEKHWHGAKEGSRLTHIMILRADSREEMFECP